MPASVNRQCNGKFRCRESLQSPCPCSTIVQESLFQSICYSNMFHVSTYCSMQLRSGTRATLLRGTTGRVTDSSTLPELLPEEASQAQRASNLGSVLVAQIGPRLRPILLNLHGLQVTWRVHVAIRSDCAPLSRKAMLHLKLISVDVMGGDAVYALLTVRRRQR
eukprot:5380728-Amphidinium_carterae.1